MPPTKFEINQNDGNAELSDIPAGTIFIYDLMYWMLVIPEKEDHMCKGYLKVVNLEKGYITNLNLTTKITIPKETKIILNLY